MIEDEKITEIHLDNSITSELHNCEANDDMKKSGYGVAIDICWQNEKGGPLWVGNGEYANTVKFCPFCGFKVDE